ncbi:MAG TPA: hypothetical protein VGO43_08845, partial [Pyrinomonadaceae bacterium]|nr:hypothetical protein [Pyrinomonadaceae bacterium]
MAKLSKAAVKGKLAEYAAAKAKLEKIERAQMKDLSPLYERHNEELKPVLAKYEPKITAAIAEVDAIAAEVLTFLDTQTADVAIAEAGFVAERKTQSKLMARVIDVKKFLERAKTKGEAMYACIRIEVKKA